MKNKKILKEKKLNRKNEKEVEMAEIDGWGLIILIIGLAMKFLGQDEGIASVGLLLSVVGGIRIFYVLNKYG